MEFSPNKTLLYIWKRYQLYNIISFYIAAIKRYYIIDILSLLVKQDKTSRE